ncbi:MAG: DEAD/DEAH box helicase family protein, partial [Endomicrobia bacterium]|nr:DEAD/DEAH box helicase family protein [Endomicrobiia bacterium]
MININKFFEEELSEADTKAKLIDPALHKVGWTEDLIHREETACPIDVIDGIPQRRGRGRIDYLLRIKISPDTQPIAVALLEAKKNTEPPDKGLEQAKRYAKLHNVPFVYSTNGYLFVEYDNFTGKTSSPVPMDKFPTPYQLRKRYEEGKGFSLESQQAKPLLINYPGGETIRRYYQDAAIRATLERIAQGKKRILLYLATGSGKTFIAVHILKKIADAGQLRKALFVCDRDELRSQALSAFQNVFGADAAEVTSSNPQKNARILIATYQTLNVASETDDAKFFIENYPENYFSHIIIDECHRSAWGKWSIILRRNPDAIQIGLTATPRWFSEGLKEEDIKDDKEITANNYKYFGEPVYEYDISQGIEDGYLAACVIIRREIDLDQQGITKEEIKKRQPKDPFTGQLVREENIKDKYEAESFEDKIQLPDRVKAMCKDLFNMLLQTGGPHQKTVIFCVRDTHADAVAIELNNLYAEWCIKNNQQRLEPYAFKCTASVSGSTYLADLRGSQRSHFIATTVDLITTGVDVPILQNVVFFRYIKSPILFHQMLGRGSRIHPPTNKLMFRVYDYTNATRLLGKLGPAPIPSPPSPPSPPKSKEKIIQVEGF